jgi:ribokinase
MDDAVVVVGSYNQDLAFETSSFPAPGETRLGTFRTGPGGKGFNQAVACHRQGVATRFVGAVGDDGFAAGLRQFVEAEGLAAELQVVPDVATGAAGIIVDETGQNLIVVGLGANDELSPDHIDSLEDTIAGAQVVATQLECDLGATRRALELARRHGVTTVLNPAPINTALDAELLELVDILVPNESEYAFMLEHVFDLSIGDPAEATDADLIDSARRVGVPTLIVTLGRSGSAVVDASANSCLRVEAIPVETIDTTGAGDAFCGGVAAGLVRFPDDLLGAVRYANVVAGLSTEAVGTSPSMPSRADVDRRLDSR